MFTELVPEEAAAFIKNGETLGCSGFTLAGAPKALGRALAKRADALHANGEPFKVGLITGASAGKSLDGALADANAISFRTPFQTDPSLRDSINEGRSCFYDMHLGLVPSYVERGILGPVDWAVIEASQVTPQGEITLTSSVGASPAFCNVAKRILIEQNSYHPTELYGIHDITNIAPPPLTDVIPVRRCSDFIGSPTIKVDPSRIVGVIRTNEPDESGSFKALDPATKKLGQNVAEFLLHELKRGAFPGGRLLPIQAGVGNVSNALIEAMVANKEIPPFSM
ncbi:MAG: acetyl-CoA hydrolase, partial [Actinomycetota bacterium]